MREIKFRFWSKKYEEMYDWETVIKSTTDLAEWFSSEDIVPLQCTGLEDINNKNIFEGDIYIHIPTSTSGVIIFSGGRFYCDNERLSRFLLAEVNNGVVIGNSYETPELLT